MKDNEIGLKNIIYFLLAAWYATEMLEMSNVESVLLWKKGDINDFMAVLVLVLAAFQVLVLQKYSFHEIVELALLTIPIAIGAYNSQHRIFASAWLFIVASKYIDIDKAIDIVFVIEILIIISIIAMFELGMIDEIVTYRGSIIRHSLGFLHPNFLGMQIFQLIAMWLYKRRQRISLFDFCLLGMAVLFTYAYPNSQSAFVSMIILCIITFFYILLMRKEDHLVVMSKVLIVIFLIVAVGSIIITFLDTNQYAFLKKLDKMLSWRFATGHMTLKHYGVTLWGQEIYGSVDRPIIGLFYKFYLDNAYMALLLRYGVVVLTIFLCLYCGTMIHFLKSKNYYMIVILFTYGIYGVMETNLFSLSKNIFLLSMSYLIFSKRYEEKSIDSNLLHKRIILTF